MAKKDVASIVSGAGWIAGFADKLIRDLRAAGKTNEEIHALVTDDGEESMNRLVAGVLEHMVPRHRVAELLEKYFAEVHKFSLNLTGVKFPEQEGFPTWMAVPPELDEDRIMQCTTEYFEVNPYSWHTPLAANIDRTKAQRRPSGLYVFAHGGGDEPDDVHRHKSYDDVMVQHIPFMNPKEYLLATGFHRYLIGYFMDRIGWTKTSSLWVDGHLVGGRWREASARLCLDSGLPDYRLPDDGLREVFLGDFSL